MRSPTPDVGVPALPLAADAAAWMLLARLFERPDDGWHAGVAELATEIDDPLLREAAGAAATARHEQHIALFGPGQAVSPREVSYIAFHEPGAVLAELRTYYREFAFTPATDEPDDHVAVETSFVGYLCLKEAYARANGDDDAALVCAEARSRFVEEHLARLGQRMTARMPEQAPDWLRHASAALHARTAHVKLPPDAPAILDPESLDFDCCAPQQPDS